MPSKIPDEIVTFEEAVKTCLDNPDFMKEYRRITKARLGTGDGLSMMIDKVTGYDKKEATDLFNFIRDYIWIPSQLETTNQ